MSLSEPSKQTRGRPSTPENVVKEKITQATAESLIEDGYQLTTIDNIARRAGVAKKTIYRFVENRESLIELVILSWTDSFVPLFEHEANSSEEFFNLLESNLNSIAQKVLSPSAVGLYRLLQTDFNQKDILLEKYQKNGIERSRHLLSKWLAIHADKKLINNNNFSIMSDLILSMAIAEPLRQISLGLIPAGVTPELEKRIQQVIYFCQLALKIT